MSTPKEEIQYLAVLVHRGHLTRDLGAAAAVRFAARTILQQRRDAGLGTHPFYWAAFLALGS